MYEDRNLTRGLGLNLSAVRPVGDVRPINPAVFAVETYSGVAAFGKLRRNETNRNDTDPDMRVAASSIVDWRYRFGVSWLATIQDQDPCESCWAFAATALVETQARIEHGYWDKRSEGDVRDGTLTMDGVPPTVFCSSTGDPGNALDFIHLDGGADLQCFPYDPFQPDPYKPCTRRDGRTTEIPVYTDLGSIAQQKLWIDLIGPIVASFQVPYSFFSYEPGTIYTTPAIPDWQGGHCVLVVGYNDIEGYWIIRNSWGPTWGDHGYAWIGYGQVFIDDYSKQGVQFTSPDPWVKSRLHNGNLIHGSNGAFRKNFELIRCDRTQLSHLSRDDTTFQWSFGPSPFVFPSYAERCDGQPAFTSTTNDRNFELVYAEKSGHLHHRYYVQTTGTWEGGYRFGSGTVQGYPGFIESDYGPSIDPGGRLEVVVRHDDGTLRHWSRSPVTATWSLKDFVTKKHVRMSGPSLVQADVGTKGNFYVVAVTDAGHLQLYWRDNDSPTPAWAEGEEFGWDVGETPPVMIQSNYGTQDQNSVGNFELLIAVHGKVQYWRRDNTNIAIQPPEAGVRGEWFHVATFGHHVRHVWSLLQGPFYQGLEAIVELRDGSLEHWYWDFSDWYLATILPTVLPEMEDRFHVQQD